MIKRNKKAMAILGFLFVLHIASKLYSQTSTNLENDLKTIDATAYYGGGIESEIYEEPTEIIKFPLYSRGLGGFPERIKYDPNNADLRNGLGYVLSTLGKHKEAIASFDKAIELEPNNALIWYNRGVSFAQLERYEEALANYNKAIELKLNDPNIWNNRGNALGHLKRFAEALPDFQKAIKLKPDFVFAWRNSGIWLERLGRNKEALANFNKVIELKPKNLDCLGDLLLRFGRYEEALALCDEILEHHHHIDIVASRFRGVVLEKLGRKEEAKKSFDWADRLSAIKK